MTITVAANDALLVALTALHKSRGFAVMFDGILKSYVVKRIQVIGTGDVPQCPSVIDCWSDISPASVGIFLDEKIIEENAPILLRVSLPDARVDRPVSPYPERGWVEVDTLLEKIKGGVVVVYRPTI